jgi:hypothetical protein
MIYLIATENDKFVKIGYSKKNPIPRLNTLQIGNPQKLRIINSQVGDPEDEHFLHKLCKKYKVQGEWFKYCSIVLNIFEESKPIIKNRIYQRKLGVLEEISLKTKIFNTSYEPQNKVFIDNLINIATRSNYKKIWVFITYINKIKTYFLSDLFYIAKFCGYKDGWVYYKIQELKSNLIIDTTPPRNLLEEVNISKYNFNSKKRKNFRKY